MMTIKARELLIGYDKEQEILKPLSMDLGPNELVVIIGDNGCGKTTLLRTLAGLLPEQAGEITKVNYSKIGFANSEVLSFFDHQTADETIRFFECINDTKVISGYEELEIYRTIQNLPSNQMSTGMKQVLKLLVTLLETKEIIIWDEPLQSLGEKTRMELIRSRTNES